MIKNWNSLDVRYIYHKLRPYQREGVAKLVQKSSSKPEVRLNYDDMGLGKTITTLTAAVFRCQKFEQNGYERANNPILILCPTKALFVWEREIAEWLNCSCHIYKGTPAKRKKEFEHGDDLFVISTYGMIKELKEYSWAGVIMDEIHEAGLFNHKTATYKSVFSWITSDSAEWCCYYLLTGTPIRQGAVDLYAPLHLVDSYNFKSYWQYVNKYCIVMETPFGKSIHRRPANLSAFRDVVHSYSLRRTKEEVLKDLPGKQRKKCVVEMNIHEKKFIEDMFTELCWQKGNQLVIAANQLDAMLKIRQFMISPKILGIDLESSAITYIMEEMTSYSKEEVPGSHIIYCPFIAGLDIIEEQIKELPRVHIYKVSGKTNSDEFNNQIIGFTKDNYPFKVLLCTTRSAASFTAVNCHNIYFVGCDFDFNYNMQAEDRCCRLGQKNFVMCNYIFAKDNPIDERIMEILNSKTLASNLTISSKELFEESLRRIKGI